GSFAPGLSLSPWPSWDAALVSDFRTSLPHDPAERIQCNDAAGALDPVSCKTASANPGYACDSGTNAYLYLYRNQEGTASFSVNLEYAPPTSWNWLTDAAWDKAPAEACMDKGLRYRKP
ncbi:MAG: hypothetical protein HYS45_03205, partial [Parcubacteria group bacterium]|nr:hypothetical protein [Parcubacteria group bacterium]